MSEQQAELYNLWRPVWAKEEQDREQSWEQVLLRHVPREAGKEYSLVELAQLGLHEVITQAQHPSGADHELRPTIEGLIQAGFPLSLRGLGWKLLLDLSVRRHRGHYNVLVLQSLGPLANQAAISGQDLTQHLSQYDSQGDATEGAEASMASADWVKHAKVWLQQIEKDLPRTFPDHPVMQGAGRLALRRVLAAYTMHDANVGYCQGMNYIAAEEDAFWSLVIVVEEVLKGYFSPDMLATKVDQRVFQQLVGQEVPTVAVHLEALGADLACVAPQWLLCAYVNSLPLETCLRVWDVLFYRKSSAILFQVGLALVDIYSEALLAARDVLEAFQVVQGMAALTHDATHLLAVADVKFSKLQDTQLATLRANAMEQVLKEDAEEEERLEQQQLRQSQVMQASQQPTGPSPAPSTTGESSRMAMVKKLLQRLDKGRAGDNNNNSTGRADSRGGVGEGGRGGGSESDLTGVGGGAGVTSDSEQEAAQRGLGSRSDTPAATSVASAPAAGRRAGNHTIPDSNDAPLLRAPAGARARADGSASVASTDSTVPQSRPDSRLAGVDVGKEGDGDVDESGGMEEGEGGYVPPAVPLFPEVKELISLSPSESTAAVPDIDDLLRVTSMCIKDNNTNANATNYTTTTVTNGAADGAAKKDGPEMVGGMVGGVGGAVMSYPMAALGSSVSGGETDDERGGVDEDHVCEQPGTPGSEGASVSKNSKIQHVNAVLWHDTPPWKNLEHFSAAQRQERDANTSDHDTKGNKPSQSQQGATNGEATGGAEGAGQKVQGAETGTGLGEDAGKGEGPAAAPAAAPAPRATRDQQPLSPALQIAYRIAMHLSPSDTAATAPPADAGAARPVVQAPAPAAPPAPSPARGPTAAAAGGGGGFLGFLKPSSPPPVPFAAMSASAGAMAKSHPSAPHPGTTAANHNTALGTGTAHSAAQLGSSLPRSSWPGISGSPDMLLDFPTPPRPGLPSNRPATTSTVLQPMGSVTTEFKDDWVDLDGVDYVQPVRTGNHTGPFHQQAALAGPIQQQVNLLSGWSPTSVSSAAAAAGPTSPVPRPGAGPAGAPAMFTRPPERAELRKTISNGWVDGALLSVGPSGGGGGAGAGSASGSHVHHTSSDAGAPGPHSSHSQSLSHTVLPAHSAAVSSGDFDLLGMAGPSGQLPVVAMGGREGGSAGGGRRSHDMASGGVSGGGGGVMTSPRPSQEAIQKVCQREGIQPLLDRCNVLEASYLHTTGHLDTLDPLHTGPHTTAASHTGSQRASGAGMASLIDADDLPGPLQPASQQTHQAQQQQLLSGLLSQVAEAARQVARIQQHGSTAGNGVGMGGGGGGQGVEQEAAKAAAHTLQIVAQQLRDALSHTSAPTSRAHSLTGAPPPVGPTTQTTKDLLGSYRGLAKSSCQKLYELAGVIAERDNIIRGLTQQGVATQQQQHSATASYYRGAPSQQLQQGSLHRLSQGHTQQQYQQHHSGDGAAVTGGSEPNGGGLMGTFQKLRDRATAAAAAAGAGGGRASSPQPQPRVSGSSAALPPVRRTTSAAAAGAPPGAPVDAAGRMYNAAAGGAGAAAPGVALYYAATDGSLPSYGSAGLQQQQHSYRSSGDEGASASRDEGGRVSKWLNKLMRKDETGSE